jgi:hypothetical protein
MEKKVLTEEEFGKISQLRENFSNLNVVAGNIEVQIMSLELEKENIKSTLKSLQQQEQVLVKELEDKYGKGTISLETKEFLPVE